MTPGEQQTSDVHAALIYNIMTDEHFLNQWFSLSLYDSFHSFSSWLFLSHRCELYTQVGHGHGNGLKILLRSDEEYHYHNGESFSIAHRWIHIALIKIDYESNYRIFIDGQSVTSLKQCQISLDELYEDSS